MKSAIIIAIIVALMAGIGYFGFAPKAAATPPEWAGPGTQVVKIFDDELVPTGPVDPENPPLASNWLDVSKYRIFKLLVRLTPGPTDISDPPPNVSVFIAENPKPPQLWDPGGYDITTYSDWEAYSYQDFDQRWAMSLYFSGLYSNISISAMEDKYPYDPADYKISLWLLMAEE